MTAPTTTSLVELTDLAEHGTAGAPVVDLARVPDAEVRRGDDLVLVEVGDYLDAEGRLVARVGLERRDELEQ